MSNLQATVRFCDTARSEASWPVKESLVFFLFSLPFPYIDRYPGFLLQYSTQQRFLSRK